VAPDWSGIVSISRKARAIRWSSESSKAALNMDSASGGIVQPFPRFKERPSQSRYLIIMTQATVDVDSGFSNAAAFAI